ncbi:MAG: metal-dependent hydrolase [Bacilli bacterium]
MKVTFHGHSVVRVETNGTTLLIDPFIRGNSMCDLDASTVTADYIILTHGHNDHVGDTLEIAKRCHSIVIAPYELAVYLSWQGLRTHGMGVGGSFRFPFGTIKQTQAIHGSAYIIEGKEEIVYAGAPSGVLITTNEGTIYHAGDTALFSDMRLIGDETPIDVAFLPIGGNFTMNIDDAVKAASLIQAKRVVPLHYNTFPIIEQNPLAFVAALPDGVGLYLKPGESVTVGK